MKKISAILLTTTLLVGCSKSNGWSVEGTAPDGVDTVYIQAPTRMGTWYNLDSTAVKNNKYEFQLGRANHTIYRLKLNDKTVYLPADSTETLSINVDGKRSGSAEAMLFNKVDSLSNNSHELLRALDGNYASIAAYYATRLNKDFRLLRTIANRYNEERPNTPQTAVLKAELQHKTPKSAPSNEQQVIFAEEIGYYDVELMDSHGHMQKLSGVIDSNSLVILAYVDFTNEDTPAITRALGDAHAEGAGIYEVGFAENQHLWANASEGLPWISVYQSDAADRTHIRQYAVASFPTFFILKNGEIVERTIDYSSLPNIIRNFK